MAFTWPTYWILTFLWLSLTTNLQGWFNTLRPRQNWRHFTDAIFKPNFLGENVRISIKISLKFVPTCPINNIPALVQIMALRRPGDKPLSEPMMVRLPMHICVTRAQCFKEVVGLWRQFEMLNPRPLFIQKTLSYGYKNPHYKPKMTVSGL